MQPNNITSNQWELILLLIENEMTNDNSKFETRELIDLHGKIEQALII